MEELQNLIYGRTIRPVHPGEVIADVLEDIEMTQTAFAEIIGVSLPTLNKIIEGQRPITADMAIRVGKALGNGPQLWLNLQQKIDIWDAIEYNNQEYMKVSSIG